MNLTLFLLLALTASRTGLVRCEEVKDGDIVENASEGEDETQVSGDGRTEDMDSDATPNSDSVGHVETNLTTAADTDEVTEDLNLVIMIIIPLVLTLVIIAVIVCAVMIYRRGRKVAGTKEDPYLDHEDHEKVPMPMFEDDIPSVMELEMEDLENWISKDGGKKVDTGQI